VQSLGARMAQSLTFDADDRRTRIDNMAAQVASADVFAWVRDELAAITSDPRAASS